MGGTNLDHGPADSIPGGIIRTISVSLLAVAAIAASIVFARVRQLPETDGLTRVNVLEDAATLEALRAAGF
jgi:hypothetical protein